MRPARVVVVRSLFQRYGHFDMTKASLNFLITRRYRSAAMLVSLLAVAACQPGETELEFGDGSMVVAPPGFLVTRAVDENNLEARVSVTGIDEPFVLTPNGDTWSGSVDVPQNSNVTLTIDWVELVDTRELMLASYSESFVNISEDESLLIAESDYEVSSFDDDVDGFNNLAERIGNSNPFDPDSPGQNAPLAEINAIAPASAALIEIDGNYDLEWNTLATFRDVSGELLKIDNLMIDLGATQLDGQPDYVWGGMHDDEYLYLVILTDGPATHTPFGDSFSAYNDDTIDIFIDADNSKGSAYDANDYHMLIPLLASTDDGRPNASGELGELLEAGVNSAPLPTSAGSIEFATCVCPTDRHIWEVRLRMADFQIDPTQAFGFEIQYNDDIDGGTRDAKWGWFHESRQSINIDRTWRFPSYMGTIQLQPSPF